MSPVWGWAADASASGLWRALAAKVATATMDRPQLAQVTGGAPGDPWGWLPGLLPAAERLKSAAARANLSEGPPWFGLFSVVGFVGGSRFAPALGGTGCRGGSPDAAGPGCRLGPRRRGNGDQRARPGAVCCPRTGMFPCNGGVFCDVPLLLHGACSPDGERRATWGTGVR